MALWRIGASPPHVSCDCRRLLVAVQEKEMPKAFLFIRSHINASHPNLLFYFIFPLCHILAFAEAGKELAVQCIGSPVNKGMTYLRISSCIWTRTSVFSVTGQTAAHSCLIDIILSSCLPLSVYYRLFTHWPTLFTCFLTSWTEHWLTDWRKNLPIQDLRFSQQCFRKFSFSGVWRCVDLRIISYPTLRRDFCLYFHDKAVPE